MRYSVVNYREVKENSDFRIDADYFRHDFLNRYQTKKNDVLITIVGNSIGDVGLVKFNLEKCNLTENCAKVSNLINVIPEFLFAFLLSKHGQIQIHREKVG